MADGSRVLSIEAIVARFGVVAIALVLAGAAAHDRVRLAAGVFALAVALNARAGAFIVLPLLALWPFMAGDVARAGRWRLAALIVVAGAAGFVPGIIASAALSGTAGASHST